MLDFREEFLHTFATSGLLLRGVGMSISVLHTDLGYLETWREMGPVPPLRRDDDRPYVSECLIST